jgi:hypothetical protein
VQLELVVSLLFRVSRRAHKAFCLPLPARHHPLQYRRGGEEKERQGPGKGGHILVGFESQGPLRYDPSTGPAQRRGV